MLPKVDVVLRSLWCGELTKASWLLAFKQSVLIGTFRIFVTRFYCPGQCGEELMLVNFLWQLENAVWSSESRSGKDIKKASIFHILSLFSGLNKRAATPIQLLARSRWFLLYALFQHPHLVQYLKWHWGYLSLVVLPSPVILRRWNEYLFNDWFILRN